jgi:hypothetical protein
VFFLQYSTIGGCRQKGCNWDGRSDNYFDSHTNELYFNLIDRGRRQSFRLNFL